jgi:DNA mismatch endonuclease (patch repair protein)|tara:strand:+ start:65 stop:478 length:414 start_codon:yes stop_codon:yes gene_type:complete
MVDHLTPEKRSVNMSRIRSVDTKPELIVRKFLFNKGFRYRTHDKTLPGKPDIANKKKKIAVFIHGCFWHQHEGCKRATMPKSNKDYWIKKLENNKLHFQSIFDELLSKKYNVFVIWECEVKNQEKLNKLYKDLITIA